MKKCPYCKTDIEENSNFCLYCMTSLNKKEVIADKMQKRSRLLVGMIIILFADLWEILWEMMAIKSRVRQKKCGYVMKVRQKNVIENSC